MKNNYRSGASAVVSLLLVVVAVLAIGLAFFVGRDPQFAKLITKETPTPSSLTPAPISPVPTVSVTSSVTSTPSTAPSPTPSSMGTIEGTLIYPSNFIPPDMQVCAENVSTKQKYCTGDQIKTDQAVKYKISLPAGDYHVYAFLSGGKNNGAGFNSNYRAYYSEFVTCGLKYGCPSHKPIVVTVSAGKNYTDINPHDWYDDTQPNN